jgi:hypothetical protein
MIIIIIIHSGWADLIVYLHIFKVVTSLIVYNIEQLRKKNNMNQKGFIENRKERERAWNRILDEQVWIEYPTASTEYTYTRSLNAIVHSQINRNCRGTNQSFPTLKSSTYNIINRCSRNLYPTTHQSEIGLIMSPNYRTE